MSAYYNEIDPFCVDWLGNLMRHGLVAPGDVDSRSIEDVRPDDLRGYTQCHFFAGIGVWSYALRRAGWDDSRRVWTGSCPCQPFSAAGKGRGLGDERHLWPAWYHLIGECRPPALLGEQVASKDAEPWLDLVHTDLETLGYAFGAVPFPAASVGAPHIRDRLYWVAYANERTGRQGGAIDGGRHPRSDAVEGAGPCGSGGALRLAHSSSTRLEGCHQGAVGHECAATERGGCACGLGDAERLGAGRHARASTGEEGGSELWSVGHDAGSPSAACGLEHAESGRAPATEQPGRLHGGEQASPLGGFWADADWIPCRDNKWRPVEPGSFPLAHGAAARVGRLRAYGNAIVAPQAEEWIKVVMECMP